jgi:PDZ domain-containing protein
LSTLPGAQGEDVDGPAGGEREHEDEHVSHRHTIGPEPTPDGSFDARPGSYHPYVRALWKTVLGALAVGIIVFSGYVYLPYYSIGPGPAREVQPLIRIEGHPRYESQGRFVLTSVEFAQLTAFGILRAWLDPDEAVVGRNVLYAPGETVQQEHQRAISQMDQSKLDAASVVLHELTAYPKAHGDGVLVEGVVSGCAADGELYPGDLIRSIDGTSVDTRRQASAIIQAAPSGSALRFDITVDGEPQQASLVREPCGGQQDPLVGVSLMNSFPFAVTISSGAIGGPSAGLMFALGLYDLLTPGDLTGGRTIAGTGEIGVDGTVYPIGGVGEKVVAAAADGATVFLVPTDNLADARKAVGDRSIELVPIATFADALAYLQGT